MLLRPSEPAPVMGKNSVTMTVINDTTRGNVMKNTFVDAVAVDADQIIANSGKKNTVKIRKLSSRRIIAIMVVAIAVLLVGGGAWAGTHRIATAPLPSLQQADHDLYDQLAQTALDVSKAVDIAEASILAHTTTDASDTDPAWTRVVLTDDSETVIAANAAIADARIWLKWADVVGDADTTNINEPGFNWVPRNILASLRDDLDPTVNADDFRSVPIEANRVMSVDQVESLLSQGRVMLGRLGFVEEILDKALATAQKAEAMISYRAALEALNAAIAQAGEMLASSDGKVQDNTVREILANAIAEAQAVCDANGSTQADGSTTAQVQESTDILVATASLLTGPSAEVQAAVDAKAQADAAAAEAARKSQQQPSSKKAPSSGSSSNNNSSSKKNSSSSWTVSQCRSGVDCPYDTIWYTANCTYGSYDSWARRNMTTVKIGTFPTWTPKTFPTWAEAAAAIGKQDGWGECSIVVRKVIPDCDQVMCTVYSS